jgi:6,7-dimethyl-8-ribityllumazine synthase
LEGLKLLVLSGQGPATAIVFAGDGPAIAAQSDLGLRIEDLNVFAIAALPSNTGFTNAATGVPVAVGISLRNCIETAIERCGVFAISATAANTPGTLAPAAPATIHLGSIAVALEGFLIETLLRDNLLSADIGLGEASLISSSKEARNIMAVVDLEVAGNLFPCNTAGVAFAEIGAGSDKPLQLNLFLLETAFRGNRVIGCSLVGLGIQGVSLPDAAIRIADNHIDVSGVGIVCGADNAEIADNLVTQAMSIASGGVTSALTVMGISVTSVPGGKLPITQARIVRTAH